MKLRRVVRWVGVTLLLVLLLALAGAGWLWWCLHASLAQLDGRLVLPGLIAPVTVTRDALGVPSISATNRVDASRALGFLHAQERFFQMDLSRRSGAGELSELVGPATLSDDQHQRVHRPRARAKAALAAATPAERELVEAYAAGVNAGLAALGARPPEYLALRTAPSAWLPEDAFLVAYSMFRALHELDGYYDYRQTVLLKALSPAALAFFDSRDTLWNAALDGSVVPASPVPTPQEFSVADYQPRGTNQPDAAEDTPAPSDRGTRGSNNWAVDGHRSGTGSAIVANDMHLDLRVPNVWYRAQLLYQDPKLGPQAVVGVTLPGTPVVVSGSNRHVAWGNTFSCLDITDLVVLETDPSNPKRYRTPEGWRELQDFAEVIHVRDGTNVTLTVSETIWGPIVSWGGTNYALACAMDAPEAVNMGLIEIERARDAQAASRAAQLAGTPVNNFVVGDRAGHIGYSLLGRLPNRVGFDGAVPCSWADGTRGWRGFLTPERYPILLDPPNGALWTANNRTLGSPEYLALHLTDEINGSRAGLIRDALLGASPVSEQTLWTIYNDNRARFLERWQQLLLTVLQASSPTNALWREAQAYVNAWGARAATDSKGYRFVRGFRLHVLQRLFEPLNQRLAQFAKDVQMRPEDAGWAMLTQKPPHLLNPKFSTYDQLLQDAAAQVLKDLTRSNAPLSKATWGARNHLGIRHPLSMAVPLLGRWLDMPDVPVSGDDNMPKVHSPGGGVSERLIVSPGHEENGLFNMPCGQSGHFLSPFYRSEMDSWLKVQPQPLLPGPKRYQLELLPGV